FRSGDEWTTSQLRLTSTDGVLAAAVSADGESWETVGRDASSSTIDNPHIGFMADNSKTGATIIEAAFEDFQFDPDGSGEVEERDDHFEGDSLNACRWDATVGQNADDYWVEDGRLWINTTSGGNFGGNN